MSRNVGIQQKFEEGRLAQVLVAPIISVSSGYGSRHST